VTELKVDAAPEEVGLDAARLGRLDEVYGRYVAAGQLPATRSRSPAAAAVAHLSHGGHADVASGRPVTDDTPVAHLLDDQADHLGRGDGAARARALELTDPVSRYIPEFEDARVYVGGSAAAPGTRPASEPIRVWHLLTHTAGLTYGFHHAHAVDEIYRARGYDFGAPAGTDLARRARRGRGCRCCSTRAPSGTTPWPPTSWAASSRSPRAGPSTRSSPTRSSPPGHDRHGVLGRRRRHPPPRHPLRPDADGLRRSGAMGDAATRPPTFLSGGGGLVSTAGDYHRFTQMLLRGGELDGVRLLSPRTVAYMTRNHLPGGTDLDAFGRPLYAESEFRGVGFGLGFSVVVDPVAGRRLSSAGEYAWGGLARTAFLVDPAEDLTALFFTQVLPGGPVLPLRSQLRTLVLQALVD
jgi:CubicO group peptidase (beta-lactamase class C family)